MMKALNVFCHWTARIAGLISLGIMMLFFIGEGETLFAASRSEMFLTIFFPGLVALGFVLAWFRPWLGGLISVCGLILFYVIHWIIAGYFPHGAAFVVFTLPGFLFLADSLFARMVSGTAAPSSRS
jgi:hypothetical protein